jgi:hypothetical protein
VLLNRRQAFAPIDEGGERRSCAQVSHDRVEALYVLKSTNYFHVNLGSVEKEDVAPSEISDV